MKLRIGLDVGGTNTDAVLMSGDQILAWNKRPTSADVSGGIATAVRDLLVEAVVPAHDIGAVMIGTTHFTNAIVERRRLGRVVAARFCLPANTGIPIAFDWPRDLLAAMALETQLLHGGVNFDGSAIAEIRPAEIDALVDRIRRTGADAVAVCAAFAPVAATVELEVRELLSEAVPGVRVSMSHQCGRIGLLERENATILNAALLKLADDTFAGFVRALEDLEVRAPLYISQNDGTVVHAEQARAYPIRTLSSGPTNSMRGAAFLSGRTDALVLDVGGTTADAGALVGGFPREAPAEHSISGVRTNFKMPEVASVGVGGGSVVSADGEVRVGPHSVGYSIVTEGLVFGGTTLTATDVAIAAGIADLGDTSRVAALDGDLVESAIATWHSSVSELLEDSRPSKSPLPVILVGGGSIIIDPGRITGFDDFLRPDHYQVANAVGAAIPQVSGEVDRIVTISAESRESTLASLREEASELAVKNGADPETVAIVDEDILGVPSMSENAARIRIRALGNLQVDE